MKLGGSSSHLALKYTHVHLVLDILESLAVNDTLRINPTNAEGLILKLSGDKFYCLKTYIHFLIKRKGDRPRWEGRWEETERSGGGDCNQDILYKKKPIFNKKKINKNIS